MWVSSLRVRGVPVLRADWFMRAIGVSFCLRAADRYIMPYFIGLSIDLPNIFCYFYFMTTKKRGRPHKVASERRTELVRILLTRDELAAIERESGKVRVSVWARNALLSLVRG